MHTPVVFGAAALVVASVWLMSGKSAHDRAAATAPVSTPQPLEQPAQPVQAQGHYALVVDGDRNALTITHAVQKPDPWAGVPKGMTSDWLLTLRDGAGAVLAEVPLDMTPFATGAQDVGKPVRVEGCTVRDPHIAMLVNVPAFATAATYTFTRSERDAAPALLGQVAGSTVRELAGGGR